MSGRYYILQDGKKLYADTRNTIAKLARMVADRTGRDVGVFQEKARRAARKLTARRNPAPEIYADHFARLDRARRELAAAERAAAAKRKTEAARKYLVEAASRRDSYRLTRKGKAAAERLAGEFRDAGYKVTVSLINPSGRKRARKAVRRRRVAT